MYTQIYVKSVKSHEGLPLCWPFQINSVILLLFTAPENNHILLFQNRSDVFLLGCPKLRSMLPFWSISTYEIYDSNKVLFLIIDFVETRGYLIMCESQNVSLNLGWREYIISSALCALTIFWGFMFSLEVRWLKRPLSLSLSFSQIL